MCSEQFLRSGGSAASGVVFGGVALSRRSVFSEAWRCRGSVALVRRSAWLGQEEEQEEVGGGFRRNVFSLGCGGGLVIF